MSLNPSQVQAVVHKDGPCMVLAGPGSGKTLTITKRIEYLIGKHHVRTESRSCHIWNVSWYLLWYFKMGI